VREYTAENGLTFREYDLDKDGKADYGTIMQAGKQWPLFYGVGSEQPVKPKDPRPFKVRKMYHDTLGNGKCEDIKLYYTKPKDNRFPDGKDRSGFPNFDRKDYLETGI
jgi:hypothetical protein